MYALAHLCFGLSLCYVSGFPVVLGMLASVLPDLDVMFSYGFPVVHRGIMHTPAAGLALGLVVFLVSGSRLNAYGFVSGYFSHLFVDSLTFSGIMALYPWTPSFSWQALSASSLTANFVIAMYSLLVFAFWHYRTRILRWKGMIEEWFLYPS
ncbi:MAG: metal-dependent hydrolase [Candidatus Nanohaloarchaeota archaeon QJJ-9]|nr:metal-dependent hydrolase [Candidatus Nanohaloarchaeota archaeon QJJ-9]